MRVSAVVFGLLVMLAGAVVANAADAPKAPAPATVQELDARLAKRFSDLKIPGATVALMENNQVVLAKGYGFADVARKIPVTPQTLFRAGSISKNFVGVAIMMLVEEGKLDLNAKLSDLAPEIKFDNPWEATDPVRLVHLMEHTTGFDDIRFRHYLLDGKDMPLLQAIKLYGPYASRWKPGTLVSYSNAPPVIAGYIVEKFSGMSWADFTRKRIFEPLGMASAHWDLGPEVLAGLAKSYRSDGVTVEPYVDIPGKPAGSLNVTPGDLAKFALMLAGRGTYNGITLLKPESVQRIETPASSLASRLGLKEGYGLGNIAIVREKTVFHGHDGGIDSFLSIYIYDPVSLSGFIAMVNTANGEALDVMDTAIAYLERNRQKPAVVPYVARPGELAKFAGVYQSKSPRQQMLAPLEALADWAQVTVEGNALVLDGVKRIPVAPNVFQRVDRMAPSVVFAETDNGIELLTATGAKRKVAESEIYVKAGFGGAFGLSLAISVIYALVWIMGWVNGRLAERGGVLVRAVPALVVLALASLAGLLLFLLADEGFESIVRIGTPSPVAVTLYAISLSIPVLGGLSLVLGLIAGHGTSLFVRGLALLNGMIGLTASAFLWSYGWIGLKTWM